jgi:SAM-dependent methyltransferase
LEDFKISDFGGVMQESPQERPEDWYAENYNNINASGIEGGIYSKFLHKFLELPFKLSNRGVVGISILEVGANIGEHIPYVSHNWKSYVATDIRSPSKNNLELIKNLGASFKIADVENLPFADGEFDRVISTCLLHHLKNPDKGLREMRRVLKNQGSLSILLPNDPGVLYRKLWNLTTLRKAKEKSLGSATVINHERQHRNHYLDLKILIEENFKNDKIRIIGFPFVFQNYSLNVLSVVYIVKAE